VFDEHFEYLHGARFSQQHYSTKAGALIRTFKELHNTIHPWSYAPDTGHNFFHHMSETMIRIFQAREFILANPHIPFTLVANTDPYPIFRLLLIKQIPPLIVVNSWETIYVEKAYMSLKIPDNHSSHAVWKQFRNFYFKQSVPSFFGFERPSTVTQLKIVMSERKKPKRSIVDFDKLVASIEEKFPGKVFIFHGDEGLKGSIDLFLDAAIYVGPHGAGMTNMMFLPYNAAILEIIPDKKLNHIYSNKASSLQFEYHMIVAAGDHFSPMTVDHNKVVEKVVEMAARFQ